MTAKNTNPEALVEEPEYMWLGYGSYQVDPASQVDAGLIRSADTFDVLHQLTGFDTAAEQPAQVASKAKTVFAALRKVVAVALLFLLFFAGADFVAWLYVYLSQLFR